MRTLILLGRILPRSCLFTIMPSSMLCDIENTASLAMVELMRHSLLESSISFDIDDISLLVYLQESREGFNSMLSEVLLEKMTGSTPVSFRVHHFYILVHEDELPHKPHV